MAEEEGAEKCPAFSMSDSRKRWAAKRRCDWFGEASKVEALKSFRGNTALRSQSKENTLLVWALEFLSVSITVYFHLPGKDYFNFSRLHFHKTLHLFIHVFTGDCMRRKTKQKWQWQPYPFFMEWLTSFPWQRQTRRECIFGPDNLDSLTHSISEALHDIRPANKLHLHRTWVRSLTSMILQPVSSVAGDQRLEGLKV